MPILPLWILHQKVHHAKEMMSMWKQEDFAVPGASHMLSNTSCPSNGKPSDQHGGNANNEHFPIVYKRQRSQQVRLLSQTLFSLDINFIELGS